ncbi:MAG: extracellular solute-binding protein [Anaerolineaceae bacterium]|nr:MAG: extracellular solute-binding protein [Anaerolineaceae bacterium]
MKRTKRVIVSIVVLCMVLLVLAACKRDTKDKTNDTVSDTNSKSDSSKISETVEDVDPFGKYDPAITITSVRDLPNPSIVKYPEGDDIENNVWTRTILEELGINVEYMWTVDSSQLSTRLNAMIAGGKLPDFFLVTGAQYQELREAELLADITYAYEAYASDLVKETINYGGKDVIDAVTQDGKMTALPTIASQEFGPMLWIRTDWLDNLNLPEPENLDDLLKVAEAFALEDPDGNGEKDTWGIPINGDTSGGLAWQLGFMNSMESYPNIWIDDGNGGLQYGSITEETKNALAKLNELCEKGVIDPEFVTRDYWANYDQITSGKYGIVYGPYYASISPLQPTVDADENAEWKAFPLLGKNGMAKMQQSVPLSGFWVISKDCENPEAVIKLLNFWYREFYESPNIDRYTKMINDGAEYTSIYSSTPIQSFLQFANLDAALVAKDVFDGKITENDMPPIAIQMYGDAKKYYDGDRSMWMWGKVYESLIDVMNQYKEKNFILADKNMAPPGDAMTSKFTSLYAMEMSMFAKIISGQASIDEFDSFVEEWKSTGGDEITAEINNWYKSR